MATEGNVYQLEGLTAGATFASKQYYFCYVSGANAVSPATALGQRCLGIEQNTPASGDAASVAVLGRSKVKLGSAATAGNILYAASDGSAVTAAASAAYYGMAVALETGAVGNIVSCALGVPPFTANA